MNRLNIVLAILGIGLALLIFNNSGGTTFGMHNDDFARVVYLLPIALMMSAAVWASRQTVSQSLRNLLIWLVVIMALATVYIYRHDAEQVGNRVFAGLMPGHAVVVTTSEGGQEIILRLRAPQCDPVGGTAADDGVVEIEARVHECRDRIANVADPTRRVVRSQHALREQVCRRDAAYSRVVEVAFLERQGNRQLVGDDRHFDATDSW